MPSKINPTIGLQEADEELINSLVLSEMKKHIPVGKGWFSEEAVVSGELSKLLYALSKEIATWIASIKVSKNGVFISTAAGNYLDRWGRDVGILRQAGETDDAFRFRIKKTLILSRVTKGSIEDVVYDNTKTEIDYTHDAVRVLEPWIYQERRSTRKPVENPPEVDYFYGRSGQTRRTGSDRQTNYSKTKITTSTGLNYYPEVIKQCYYQGGVIDVVTPGFSEKTRSVVKEMIAAGVKAFFTVVINYRIDNPTVASSSTVSLSSVIDVERYADFGINPYVTRSGVPDNPDRVAFLEEDRTDIVGLVGRSGSKQIFPNREIDYFPGEDSYAFPSPDPSLVSPSFYAIDSYPAYRSIYRKELSPRSGAEGSVLSNILGWTADTLAELPYSTSIQNKDEIFYETFFQFGFASVKNFVRSSSRRSGPINPSQDTELVVSSELALSATADIQYDAEYFKYDLIGSFKSIIQMPLFPRSGAEQESQVFSPVSLDLLEASDIVDFGNPTATVATELVFPFLEKSFEETVAYSNDASLEFEVSVPATINYLNTVEELTYLQGAILAKTWEELGAFTWEQALSVGGSSQTPAEVIVEP